MNGIRPNARRFPFGTAVAFLLSAVSLNADPVAIGEGPPRLQAVVPIVFAILLEAVCILLILRRRRKPRLFILWLLAMHALTYPLFLGWLWLAYGANPTLAVLVGEGVIVLLEGGLIYLICRFLSSAKSGLPTPSISKSLFASLIGNVVSAAAFPFLIMLYGVIASSLGISVLG
jgi:hypothetical protein